MDFSISEPLMLKYGISLEQIDVLKALAAKLPSDVVDGTRMPLPCIPGLSAFESELLIERMLDVVAPIFGVGVEGSELLDLAGYPSMLELMTVAERQAPDVHPASASEKPHLHV